MRALVSAVVIAGCGWTSAPQKKPRPKPARVADLLVKQPLDPIEALAPTDDDEVSWLVPGRIRLEAGGAAIEAPGGNRPIEVKLIGEQGSIVRVALLLEHVRFSVWSDRGRLLAIIASPTPLAPFVGAPPTEMAMTLRRGAKVKRLARKDRWTQVRYVGAVSADGWVPGNALVASVPRRDVPGTRRHPAGRKTLMTVPGTVIRAEPRWSGRQLAVTAHSHFLDVAHERDDGWLEVHYSDGELLVHGFASRRDPPGRAHRFSDPDPPPAIVTPNTKVPSGTCLHARAGGESIGYVVGDQPVEVGEGTRHGWWTLVVDSPWGPLAFAARGPDAQSLERCAPEGSVPPPAPPKPSVP